MKSRRFLELTRRFGVIAIALVVVAACLVMLLAADQPSGEGTAPMQIGAEITPQMKAAAIVRSVYGQVDDAMSTDIIAACVWHQVIPEVQRLNQIIAAAKSPAEAEQAKQRLASLQKMLAAEPEQKAETYYAMIREQHTLAYQAYCAQREAEAAGKRLPK